MNHIGIGRGTNFAQELEFQWDNFIMKESWTAYSRYRECCTFSAQVAARSLISKNTLGL